MRLNFSASPDEDDEEEDDAADDDDDDDGAGGAAAPRSGAKRSRATLEADAAARRKAKAKSEKSGSSEALIGGARDDTLFVRCAKSLRALLTTQEARRGEVEAALQVRSSDDARVTQGLPPYCLPQFTTRT